MYTYEEYKQNMKKFNFERIKENDWIFYIEIDKNDNIPFYSEWRDVLKNDVENRRVFITKHISVPYDNIRKITDRWGNIMYDDGKDYTPIF